MNEPEDRVEGRTAVVLAGCLYLVMVLGAVLWLWLRNDLGALAREAIGSRGQWASLAAGLGAGLLGTACLAGVSRLVPAFAALEARVAGLLGTMTDRQALWLSLSSAVGEELLFRLAVQQALGFWWSVVLFTLLNTGPGLWAWSIVAFVMGLSFCAMVEWGLGLLSVTVAHAIVTYLSLRRLSSNPPNRMS